MGVWSRFWRVLSEARKECKRYITLVPDAPVWRVGTRVIEYEIYVPKEGDWDHYSTAPNKQVLREDLEAALKEYGEAIVSVVVVDKETYGRVVSIDILVKGDDAQII